jgi:hypothetical protein
MPEDPVPSLALKQFDDRLSVIGSCSDGHCIIKRPKGMHTNGGCRCYRDGFKMQQFAYAVYMLRAGLEMEEGFRPELDNEIRDNALDEVSQTVIDIRDVGDFGDDQWSRGWWSALNEVNEIIKIMKETRL